MLGFRLNLPKTYRPDAEILADPRTRAIRNQIAPVLSMYAVALDSRMESLPSYMREALTALIESADRFAKEVDQHGR